MPRSREKLTPNLIEDAVVTQLFGVEIECCARCGGELKIIASIEEPQLIAKILSHRERAAPEQYQSELPLGKRGSPLQPSLSHAVLRLVRGEARLADWLVYVLAALCVVRFIYLAG